LVHYNVVMYIKRYRTNIEQSLLLVVPAQHIYRYGAPKNEGFEHEYTYEDYG